MRELLKQALDAFEFNLPVIEDFGSKEQLTMQHRAIAKLYSELAKHEQALDKKADNARELGLNYEPDHGFDRTASHMAGEYVSTEPENVNASEERVQILDKNVHEPVAYVEKGDLYWCDDVSVYDADKLDGLTLYTAPPSKEWKGLSDQDIVDELSEHAYGSLWVAFARRIESKLRSKNS